MPYKKVEDWNAWNKRRNEENAKALIELRSKPCTDCGGKFPYYVMEFDHVPERGKKISAIGAMNNRKVTAKRFQEELKKCDLVCANCHAIRTHKRRQ